jgi:hypothetical protein
MNYTVTDEDGTKVMDIETNNTPAEVEKIIIEGFITHEQDKMLPPVGDK